MFIYLFIYLGSYSVNGTEIDCISPSHAHTPRTLGSTDYSIYVCSTFTYLKRFNVENDSLLGKQVPCWLPTVIAEM